MERSKYKGNEQLENVPQIFVACPENPGKERDVDPVYRRLGGGPYPALQPELKFQVLCELCEMRRNAKPRSGNAGQEIRGHSGRWASRIKRVNTHHHLLGARQGGRARHLGHDAMLGYISS